MDITTSTIAICNRGRPVSKRIEVQRFTRVDFDMSLLTLLVGDIIDSCISAAVGDWLSPDSQSFRGLGVWNGKIWSETGI